MLDEPFHRPAKQLGLFADDDAPAAPQVAREHHIELSEVAIVGIKGNLLAGRSIATVATMFGISERRVLEANDTPTSLDGAGPTDDELDALFGPRSRPPTASRDASHGIGTIVESTATADAS